MTTQTAFSVEQGPVDPAPTERIAQHVSMATSAQFISQPLGLEGGRRGGGFVTRPAHAIGHGAVEVFLQKAFSIRSMNLMTGGAIRFADGIIQVFLEEIRLIHGVAA